VVCSCCLANIAAVAVVGCSLTLDPEGSRRGTSLPGWFPGEVVLMPHDAVEC
jgi:hypothetical protein